MTVVADYLAELIMASFRQDTPNDIPKDITVDEIVKVAKKHHMVYILLNGLLKTNLTDEIKKQLLSLAVNSIVTTAIQGRELRALEANFEKSGIMNQPLKGACIRDYYPTPEMREMSDIDILILDDMSRADTVLKDMGYQMIRSIHHHDIYLNKDGIMVEAHRSMYDKVVDRNQYEYFEMMSKRHVREQHSYTYDFNVEDYYIYMISHMAKHFYVRGCGVRNLIDIYVYNSKFGKEMNTEYLQGEFAKCNLTEFEYHMKKLSYLWLEKKEKDTFYNNLFQYMLDAGIYGKDENGIWNRFVRLKEKDQKDSRSYLKRWYYFPPVSYLTDEYPWLERRNWLLPMAWFMRGIRCIKGKKNKDKRKMLQTISDKEISTIREIYCKLNLKFSK